MSSISKLTSSASRPVVYDYRSISSYVADMLIWRKYAEPSFSVRRETARIQGLSHSLIAHIGKGRRKLTRDRVDALAQVLALKAPEVEYLDQWLRSERTGTPEAPKTESQGVSSTARRPAQNHLLKDWLNVYVKDACALSEFKPNANVIFKLLGGIATPARIERSLRFLIQEGFIRRDLKGRYVKNDSLTTTSDGIPSSKIRAFHKRALEISRAAIDKYPSERRRGNALVLCLNDESAEELKALLRDFYEKLLSFAERHAGETQALYQVLIHLTPIGGSHDDSKSTK